MIQYLELMHDVLNNGVKKNDRTGIGTLSAFGRQIRFDLSEGFPLLTTKKLHTRSIIMNYYGFYVEIPILNILMSTVYISGIIGQTKRAT